MPWNGQRKHKPLEVDHCCCGQCGGACPDPPGQGIVRCDPCHYGERHPTDVGRYLHWYCAAAGHGDDKCENNDQHRRKLAGEHAAISEMLRGLDHAIEVSADAKWGQMTFESLAEES